MTSPDAYSFSSACFDSLLEGEVNLGVPLYNDVIQIGAVGDTIQGRILVARGHDTLTVARTDGSRLQAETVTAWPADDEDDGPQIERTSVFVEPIEELELREHDVGGRTFWLVDHEAAIASSEAFTKFARTVGRFAALKQDGESLKKTRS